MAVRVKGMALVAAALASPVHSFVGTNVHFVSGLNNMIPSVWYKSFFDSLRDCKHVFSNVDGVDERYMHNDFRATMHSINQSVMRSHPTELNVIMAHSSSADAAIQCALDMDRVHGLVLLDPVVDPSTHTLPCELKVPLLVCSSELAGSFQPAGRSADACYHGIHTHSKRWIVNPSAGHSDILDPMYATAGKSVGIESDLNPRYTYGMYHNALASSIAEWWVQMVQMA